MYITRRIESRDSKECFRFFGFRPTHFSKFLSTTIHFCRMKLMFRQLLFIDKYGKFFVSVMTETRNFFSEFSKAVIVGLGTSSRGHQ